MPTVHIPAPLRALTADESDVTVSGGTLGELADGLEARFPGIRARLVEGERIRPGLAVFVNSVQVSPKLTTKVAEDADIYFAPAIAGG
jgi:molybdopterin synthase sulfur carrier subunit